MYRRLRSFRARVAALMFLVIVISYLCIYLLYKMEQDDELVQYFINSEDVEADVGQYPVIIWWTEMFFGGPGRHRKCGNEVCYFTNDRKYFHHEMTMGFMFYGTDFKPTDLPLPRSMHHDWALLHEESPKNNYLFSTDKVMELFNHTSTFRQASDSPLTLQYLNSLETITSKKYFLPTEQKNGKLRDLSPAVYVHSDCDTPSDRDSYVSELMKHIKVDSYGKCLNNKELPLSLSDPMESMISEEFLKILAQYKFNLAFENAVCEDYITEKFWRALEVGSVPVYYGSPTIENWLPNPNAAISVNNFESPKHLAEYLHLLNGNGTLYEKHLEHKISQKISNENLKKAMKDRPWNINNDLEKGSYIDYFECLVCKRISKNYKRRNKGLPFLPYRADINHYGCPKPVSPLTGEPDPKSWWLDQYNKAQYEASALRVLMDMGRNFTAPDFFSEVIRQLENEAER